MVSPARDATEVGLLMIVARSEMLVDGRNGERLNGREENSTFSLFVAHFSETTVVSTPAFALGQ